MFIRNYWNPIFLIYKRNTFPIKAKDVSSIEIAVDGLGPSYVIHPEFKVVDKENIENILKALLDKRNGKLDSKVDTTFETYDIQIVLNNGDVEEYSLGGNYLPSEHMSDVIDSEEVIRQIRKEYTINKDDICQAEYNYANEDLSIAIDGKIQDKESINKIIELAQRDTLINPDNYLNETKSFVNILDSKNNLLLQVMIYKDMEGYDEIVDLLVDLSKK